MKTFYCKRGPDDDADYTQAEVCPDVETEGEDE